jgi:autotransporter-associated beta strand protein
MRNAKRKALILAAATTAAATVLINTRSLSAASVTWNGGGIDNNWSTALNWTTGGRAHRQRLGGLRRLLKAYPSNDRASGTAFNGITFTSTAGAFTLNGNSITLNGDIVDNTALLTQTVNMGLILNAQRNISVTDSGFLTISGPISESGVAGFTKLGNGTLTLSGSNSFTGTISVNAGALAISNANNLGAPTATGAIVINGGALRATGNLTIPASRGVFLGPAGTAGSGTFDVATGNTLIYGGVIGNNAGGNGSLVKYSFGTLTLSGANTYSGSTMVKNGSLVLDFSAAGAPASNILPSGTNLTIGGATAGLGSPDVWRALRYRIGCRQQHAVGQQHDDRHRPGHHPRQLGRDRLGQRQPWRAEPQHGRHRQLHQTGQRQHQHWLDPADQRDPRRLGDGGRGLGAERRHAGHRLGHARRQRQHRRLYRLHRRR